MNNVQTPTSPETTAEMSPSGPPKSTPSKRGGARPGAGRKPKAVTEGQEKAHLDAVAAVAKVASEAMAPLVQQTLDEVPLVVAVATARKRIGRNYPAILDSMFDLLQSNEQVTRKYEPAGLVQVEEWTQSDDKGRQARVKRPLFPDRDPDEMVLVSETIVTYPPDATIAQFLFNRLAGKPAEEKTNPLEEDSSAAPPVTRQELLADLLEMMIARWERNRVSQPVSDAV